MTTIAIDKIKNDKITNQIWNEYLKPKQETLDLSYICEKSGILNAIKCLHLLDDSYKIKKLNFILDCLETILESNPNNYEKFMPKLNLLRTYLEGKVEIEKLKNVDNASKTYIENAMSMLSLAVTTKDKLISDASICMTFSFLYFENISNVKKLEETFIKHFG